MFGLFSRVFRRNVTPNVRYSTSEIRMASGALTDPEFKQQTEENSERETHFGFQKVKETEKAEKGDLS